MLPEDEPSEKMYKQEEKEIKIAKIDTMEVEIQSIKTEMRIMQKRIKRLQDGNPK